MAHEAITTSDAPPPVGTFSQAVRAGQLVFTAGFGPQDPVTGEIVGEEIEEQTRQVLRNIAAVLAADGLTLADIVKTTVHLADLDDWPGFNEVYKVTVPQPYPARTTCGSSLTDVLVEIDVVAMHPAA